MDIKNCSKCGKIFVSSGSLVCPECFKEEEEQFEIVKQFLSANKMASAREVSEGTGVPVEVVTEFIRRGFLVGTAHGYEKSKCAICKKPIPKGKICAKCQEALSGAQISPLDSDARVGEEGPKVSMHKQKPKTGEQMYTIDLIRRKRR